jgi:hypothetical protein
LSREIFDGFIETFFSDKVPSVAVSERRLEQLEPGLGFITSNSKDVAILQAGSYDGDFVFCFMAQFPR